MNIKIILSLIIVSLIIVSSCEDKDSSINDGNIIFWKNTSMINCAPVTVKVYIAGDEIGTISKDFEPYETVPECGAKNCLTVKYPVGSYDYKADYYCGNEKVGFWTGSIEIVDNNCTKIYLDILKSTEY